MCPTPATGDARTRRHIGHLVPGDWWFPGLDARQIIDRAKAVVMARQAMTEQQAFRWLQRAAMNRRTSIRAVACLVIRYQPSVTPRVCHGAGADNQPRPRPDATHGAVDHHGGLE